MAKFHIKTGDTVMVIAGTSKGQQGRVVRMIPKQHRAVVEGVNMITKHLKPSASNPQGGIEKNGSTHPHIKFDGDGCNRYPNSYAP